MRPRFFFAALPIMAIAASCTSGGGGGKDPSGDGDLTTGQYEVSDADVDADDCVVMEDLDGRVIDVVVGSDGTITWDGAAGTIDDGVFEVRLVEPLDFNDDPFGEGALDCTVERELSWFGITSADDVADVEYEFYVNDGEGAQCAEAEAQVTALVGQTVTFPCTSAAGYVVTRRPDPPVHSGTITLVATNGLLTTDATVATNAGFTMSGVLDGSAFSEPSDVWSCFLPTPPTFPNYDLYIGSDYIVTLSITTADWAVGSVAIADLNEASLSGPGFAATITSGTLEILGAPVVVGSSYRCAVSLTDAPFTNQP